MTITDQVHTLGDVSGDGKINLVDVLYVIQYYNNTKTFTNAEKTAADVNRDEMEEEFKAIFDAPPTEEELAYEKEFNAATTVEERTAVMKKYKVGPFRDGAEGVIPED